jgi:hypothetical protein
MSQNSALMVEWGMPIEGRETKALEEFMTHHNWWSQLKSSGKIADFRTYGPLTGHFNERAGFVILEGTEKQIQELHSSEDFRVRINHVMMIGHNIQVTLLETGDAMMTRMQRYGKGLKERLG